jgi:hypothetical protein
MAKNEGYLLEQKLHASKKKKKKKKRTQQEADLLAVDYTHQVAKQFQKEIFSDHTNANNRPSESSPPSDIGRKTESVEINDFYLDIYITEGYGFIFVYYNI